ncbi:VPA1262 family N-terminal domain-containing protein [Methanobacterium sp.]|uniref:VPA1262 family N-terminal domain-containing protein n=1 Tax=Methanobacterium sp. TaxID=2164 RepID=UPI002600A57D|nr:VPA1262 family N-terminal domain-containing protein [Methanobacterium sp.]MBI5458255.1 hypothetical protein [Methanobacterium sp.]
MEGTHSNEDIKNDFNTLLVKGNIAFYNSSEITNIFLIQNSKTFLNIFTLVVLEESDEILEREKITKKLHKINPNMSLGISRERITIDETKSIFENLLKTTEVKSNIWNIDEDDLHVDDFKILSKKFVPSIDNDTPLNNVLKNNDENGSFIIEFFSEEKSLFKNLNENEYKKICHKILEYLPIDFLFLKDRMFNVIFQFPITLFSVETRASNDWKDLKLKLGWHPLLKRKIPEIEMISSSYDEKDIVGSGIYSGIIDAEKTIKSGNVDAEVTTIIKDKNTGLFLWYYKGYYLKGFKINSNIYGSHPNKKIRIININNNEHKIELEPIKKEYSFKKSYKDWINDRKYDDSLIKLIEEKKFVPYGIRGSNNREQALKDLRIIIQENSENGVYLWDPFARSSDLLNTLYFCPYINSEMKVITSFSKKTKNVFNEDQQFENLKNNQINILKSNSNSEGINLEIRCQRENYGWKFHDRFLIFPFSIKEKPKVWSLGTSINKIGVQHSILMEVNNPQNILDAFNDLWDDLKDSILWKCRED